jgi:hypothetical protein
MHSKLMALLIVAVFAGSAAAQDIVPSHTHVERPRLFSWVLPSDTGHYIGYHVGGGANHPHKAEPRRDEEGTWGWDYQGWLLHRRVILGWWHGQRDQGGVGAYRTDGAQIHRDK